MKIIQFFCTKKPKKNLCNATLLFSIQMFYLSIYFTIISMKHALTFEGEGRAQRVQLGRRLVGVHAVAQSQLGNAAAVLSPEVVGYRIIILCSVCEGLRHKGQKRPSQVKLQECRNDWTQNNCHVWKSGASISFQAIVTN